MSYKGIYILGLVFILWLDTFARADRSGAGAANPGIDSLELEKERPDTSFEYVAHPVLRIMTWPLEKLVVPVFKTAFYPAMPPLRYIYKNDVLDKSLDLMRFGENDQIMLYPVLVIATGTGSLTGFTYRNYSIFGRPSEKLVVQYVWFVNGNQKLRSRLAFNGLAHTRLNMKLYFLADLVKNQYIPHPHTTYQGNYSDTSSGGAIIFSHPLLEKISAEARYYHMFHDFGHPPLGFDRVQCPEDAGGAYFFSEPECDKQRGITQKFHDNIFVLGLERNTVNNENIPTSGSEIAFRWAYHYVTENHDYHEWEAYLIKYFFLGIEKYAISAEEQKRLGPLNFDKIRQNLKYQNLKKRLLNRKVIATQLRLGQSYEIKGHDAPVYALKAIGNGTPLRGYASSPFRDYAMGALSLEYRFPIMNLVEGTIFNEYGLVGPDVLSFEMESLKNSWGFGLRFSREDIFLFRTQLGFHGSHIKPVINITVDTVY